MRGKNLSKRQRPKFQGASTTTNTMIPIPMGFRAQLLPSPLISVPDLLRYPLPTQLRDAQNASDHHRTTTVAEFGRQSPPDSRDVVDIIRGLPIPPEGLLSNLLSSSAPQIWTLIRYPHLPEAHSASQSSFPLWVLTYWKEAARLQTVVRRLWALAEAFLIRTQQASWKTPEARQLCDNAGVTLLQLPWGGRTVGFGGDGEPMHLFACYLSDQWLQTTHINQQLDLLRLDLKHVGVIDCELITPCTFDILKQLYRSWEAKPYQQDTHQNI